MILLLFSAPVTVEYIGLEHGANNRLTCVISGSHVNNITWYKYKENLMNRSEYAIDNSYTQGRYSYGQGNVSKSVLVMKTTQVAGDECLGVAVFDGVYYCKTEGGEQRSKPYHFQAQCKIFVPLMQCSYMYTMLI